MSEAGKWQLVWMTYVDANSFGVPHWPHARYRADAGPKKPTGDQRKLFSLFPPEKSSLTTA